MATVTFNDATRVYQAGGRPAVDHLNLHIDDGEFLVLVGPSGCGKSTTLRMLAGLEPIDDGRVHIGDRDVTDAAASRPRHRDGVPELRALPAHDRGREHRLPPEDQEGAQGRDRRARGRGREAARPRGVPRAQAGEALGRPAPARGDGPGHRAPAAGVPDGRAAVQPRRQAARADAHADRCAAAPPGRHHRVRHARPGRGDDHGRPRRRAEGRPAAAVRLPPRAVHPAGEHVRRRVHRLAGDEHGHLLGRRGWRRVRVAAASRSPPSSAPRSRRRRSRSGVRPEGLPRSAPTAPDMRATILTVEELGSDSFLYCTPEGHPDLTVVSRAEGLSGAKAGDAVVLRPDHGALHLFDTGNRRCDCPTESWRHASLRHSASTRTSAPSCTWSAPARPAPTCPAAAARSAPAASRRPNRTTCAGSATVGRRCPASAARWCSTRRSTTPRSRRSASTGARKVIDLWAAAHRRARRPRRRATSCWCFENRGPEVGATIAHPHGQIYAYDHVPDRPLRLLEAKWSPDLAPGDRLVAEHGGWVASVPLRQHLPDRAVAGAPAAGARPAVARRRRPRRPGRTAHRRARPPRPAVRPTAAVHDVAQPAAHRRRRVAAGVVQHRDRVAVAQRRACPASSPPPRWRAASTSTRSIPEVLAEQLRALALTGSARRVDGLRRRAVRFCRKLATPSLKSGRRSDAFIISMASSVAGIRPRSQSPYT